MQTLFDEKPKCGDGQVTTLTLRHKTNQSLLQLLDVSLRKTFDSGIKKLIFHTKHTLQIRSFDMIFFRRKNQFSSCSYEKVCVQKIETLLIYVFNVSHNQHFDGSIKTIDISSLFFYKTLTLPMQNLLHKASPWWRKRLTTTSELNQSELHPLDASRCRNFNAGITKGDFPIPSFAMCEVSE